MVDTRKNVIIVEWYAFNPPQSGGHPVFRFLIYSVFPLITPRKGDGLVGVVQPGSERKANLVTESIELDSYVRIFSGPRPTTKGEGEGCSRPSARFENPEHAGRRGTTGNGRLPESRGVVVRYRPRKYPKIGLFSPQIHLPPPRLFATLSSPI